MTPTQYEGALSWLRASGLISESGRPALAGREAWQAIVEAYIAWSEPPWLPDADELIASVDDVPIDVVEICELLNADADNALVPIKRAWRKFDNLLQLELGRAGELALLEWLSSENCADVQHVSEVDDTAGFDIAATSGRGVSAHIEVKSTRRIDSIRLYVSRNEYETMRTDERWCLQIVRLNQNNDIDWLGWLDRDELSAWAPRDISDGSWASMKLTLPLRKIRLGAAPQVGAVIGKPF